MKFFRAVSSLLIITSLAQGKTYEDLVCSLEPRPVGLCVNRIVGYTYSELRNRCVIYEARGCDVRGNYFTNRDDCEVKCKPASTLTTSLFSYYVERYFFKIRNLLRRMFNSNLENGWKMQNREERGGERAGRLVEICVFLPRAVAKNGEIQSEREDYDLEGTLEADVDAVFAKLH
ncbi:uncharacterized protein LOC119547560 [Drosophila subpulchrella]|uniref:uncharacterized protein LOC119547560 n=1 Tax=Drosophila subpulchrella TaxID=1486046 RepID=UPI0018A1AF8E|nr:uncharacterized protein LOC119547560 [Drosophila subpulchrella]